jgi:HAD superfamily hydrolase (TIGR01509 family)
MPELDRFRAVIFDMDGLLVDSESVWEVVEREMIEDHGNTYSAEFRSQVVGLRLDAFFARLKTFYHLEGTIEALQAELTDRMLARIPVAVQAQPGAREMVAYAAASGLPVAIASSSPQAIIDATIAAQGWSEVFARRYSADAVALGKPAPDVYLYAASALGVPPDACLALEDSPNGALAAVAAGMTCFAVPDPHHAGPQDFAGITPHIFESLHSVIAALRQPTPGA